MRKLKVYLDTSVVSHLLQEDVLEKMADTRRLWEMFKAGKFESSSARFLRFAHVFTLCARFFLRFGTFFCALARFFALCARDFF